MKNINFYKNIIVVLLLTIMSCSDDLLDRFPEDAASDATFFTKASDFENYANGLYGSVIRRRGQSNHFETLESNTDNIVGLAPFTGIFERNNTGVASQTDGTWNGNYNNIRSVNYMLNSQDKLLSRDATADHYIGEGYFMRAMFYFNLLQRFGGVPYIDEVLGTESEDLYKTRESRDFIATKIIEDLDEAISLLQWKGSGAAVTGRINKESALHLKTRVGLFEGSWEYYHGIKNTPFAVNGSDGSVFLNAAVSAGNALIDYQGSTIYKGPAGDEYSRLFNNDNGGTLPGVFLARDYNVALGQAGNRPREGITPQFSLTKTAVDNYLMSDGLPQEISTVTGSVDIANQNSVINSRDPRLRQTLYAPDRGQRQDFFAGLNISAEGVLGKYWPASFQSVSSPGYYVLKGAPLTTETLDLNDIDDVIFRYAESLLNFAEAKAILGTITQSDIDNTVNVLRGRVGAAEMNLSTVNGWGLNYAEEDGYDSTASNIVNEIRRERRMELMMEGFRGDDLKRWALYEEVINGYVPVSAYYQELVDFYNIEQNLIESQWDQGLWENVKYKEGVNSGQVDGYLTPFWQNPDFNSATSEGYYIEPGRDYLQSIPQVEIDHYLDKGNVELTQNPGWI